MSTMINDTTLVQLFASDTPTFTSGVRCRPGETPLTNACLAALNNITVGVLNTGTGADLNVTSRTGHCGLLLYSARAHSSSFWITCSNGSSSTH